MSPRKKIESELTEVLAALDGLFKQCLLQRAMLEGCGHFVVEGPVTRNARNLLVAHGYLSTEEVAHD